MNKSDQTYKELSIPYFKETFDCIDKIMSAHQIPYYLIGANAIALELLNKGIKPSRGTRDIDFAIMISSFDEYKQITRDLIANGFIKTKEPYRFNFKGSNLVIDVLPFGQIEEQYTEDFNKRNVDLHLLGFKEVLEDSISIQIEEKIANIPPLPGMIILKLIAWNDRPEQRENDLADILTIIQHFFELEYDEIVEFHYDTFPKDDTVEIDQLLVAAEVLGRKAKLFLNKSEELSNRIYQILETNLQVVSQSEIAKDWALKLNTDIEYSFSILESFQKGISTD